MIKVNMPLISANRQSAKHKNKLNLKLFTIVLSLLATGVMSGCGQKGDLYHPEDAPSNTKFLLYNPQNQTKNPVENKDDTVANSTTDNGNSTSNETDSSVIKQATESVDSISGGLNQEQIADILTNPNDY